MATRNQVLSLFGASPEQIMQQEAMRQTEIVQSIRNPYQQMGTAIGVGLGRLFGGESADVTRQRELYSQLQGVNFESPEQMRAAAATLASQFPDRALQLLAMADQRETSAQQRATLEAQAEEAQATSGFKGAQQEKIEGFEKVQTIVPQTVTDALGGSRTSYKITEITVPTSEAQSFRDTFNERYKALTGNDAPDVITADDARGTFVARRYVNGDPIDVYVDDEGNQTAYTADGEKYTPAQPTEQLQSTVTPSTTTPNRRGQMGKNR
jgi:hypothetical protein